MLWLLFLPFTIVFSILAGLVALPFALLALPFVLVFWLPFAILKFVFRLVLLPIVLLAAGLGMLLAATAVLGVIIVPLIPLAFLVLCGYVLWRLTMGPVRGASV